MALVDNLHVERFKLIVTFGNSIRSASINNGDFLLLTNDATPVQLAGFETITIADDYDSIRRRLTLYFADLPDTTGDYLLRIKGLVTTLGQEIAEQDILFPYPFDNTDIEKPVEEPPAADVQIEDHSIRANAFVSTDYVANPDFYIVSTDPEDNEIFVENDYNDGRLAVEFSVEPSLSFVTPTYFKVQRKKIQLAYSKWETVADTKVVADSEAPKVYISLPAVGENPIVYDQPGFTYYEDGYKYRLKIHPNVATVAG